MFPISPDQNKIRQESMTLLHQTHAEMAVKNGLPNHENDRKLRRRAKWRSFRYEISTDGFFVALDRLLHGESGT